MFKKTGLRLPKKLNLKIFSNSFIIIFLLMLSFIVFSWIGHLAHLGHIKGLGVMDVFPAVWQGFVERSQIILFVFAIGGVLAIMEHSKVLDAGVAALTRRMHGKEVWLIPFLMILFGLGGTTYGMWEETLAFFPVIIPVFIKAKFDGITGVLVVLLGAGTGCLASSINPFSVGLAFQTATSTAGHLFSQGTHLIFRWLIWIIFMVPAITFVMWYAIRVRKGKRASFLTPQNNALLKEKFVREHHDKPPAFTMRRKISLSIFFAIFVIMIISYLPWNDFLGKARISAFNHFMNHYFFWLGTSNTEPTMWGPWGNWYFVSVASLFLIASLVIGWINRHDFRNNKNTSADQKFSKIYFAGVSVMIPVCLLIAVASGLGNILLASQIGEWIASSVSGVSGIGIIGFGLIIFFISLILSILIPSTSGFAAAFIPVFTLTIVGAWQNPATQAAVVNVMIIAFLLASGLANFFTPTSAPLMAYTQYATISYGVWWKSLWKFFLMTLVICVVVVILSGALIPHVSF